MARFAVAAWRALGASPPAAGTVTITVGDLPVFGGYAPIGNAERITADLLRGFRRHGWRVTGFVNEVQLEGPDRTRRIGLLED